jgi:hypothetical protein
MRPRARKPALELPLLLALVLCGSGLAQNPAFVRTGDGSSFLLVPLKTRTVHWINLHPARLEDEPSAYPDLAIAVVRASLVGEAMAGDAMARPKKASPLAWEKALRKAPTSGSELVRVGDHVGVRVSFPARSLGQVAQLLKLRTRRAKLHGIAGHYHEAKLARDARLSLTPDLDLMRRTLDASDPVQKPGSLLVRGGARVIDEDEAMAFYRWNYHPTRSVNILVGSFDAKFASDVLNAIFREPVTLPAKPESGSVDLRSFESAIVSDGDTLMVAYPLPSKSAPGLDLLIELLAGDKRAFLPESLRASGHEKVLVRAQARFPAGGNMLLIQVTDPDPSLGDKSLLPKHVKAALAQLRKKLPEEAQVRRARTALESRRARQLGDQQGLAELLARRWIRAAVPDPKKLDSHTTAVTGEELQRLATELLDQKSQTLTTASRGKPR